MPPCDSPYFSHSHMHRTKSDRSRAKRLQRKRRFMSSIKGVSHLSRRAKRRLYFKLQLWMWRRWKAKCSVSIYRTRKQSCASPGPCFSIKTQSQKSKIKTPAIHTPHLNNAEVGISSPVCGTGESEEPLQGQNFVLCQSESVGPKQTSPSPSSSLNLPKDVNSASGDISGTLPPQKEDTLVQLIEMTGPLEEPHADKALSVSGRDACGLSTNLKDSKTVVPAQGSGIDAPSGRITPVTPCKDRPTNNKADENITLRKRSSSQADVSSKILTKDIHGIFFYLTFFLLFLSDGILFVHVTGDNSIDIFIGFLDDFYSTYGSFTPLQKREVLRHLKRKHNTDFTDRYIHLNHNKRCRSLYNKNLIIQIK